MRFTENRSLNVIKFYKVLRGVSVGARSSSCRNAKRKIKNGIFKHEETKVRSSRRIFLRRDWGGFVEGCEGFFVFFLFWR